TSVRLVNTFVSPVPRSTHAPDRVRDYDEPSLRPVRTCRLVPGLHRVRRGTRPALLMRYHALACDYDGTLAQHGAVDQSTVAALERLRASGRKLLMVTGRQVDDLIAAFP